MIRALALEYPGSYSVTLMKLARLLDQDVPWIEALEQTPGALPSDTVLALRLGLQGGIVLPTFEQLRQENSVALLEQELPIFKPILVYWFAVSIVMFYMLGLFSLFIGPTLLRMMEEFELRGYGYSKLKFVLRYAIFPPLIALGLTTLAIVLSWSESLRNWIGRLIGRTENSNQTHSALLRMLANAIEFGRPIGGTLSTLAKYHYDSSVRKNLLVARNEIEQGSDGITALETVGLLTPTQRAALVDQSAKNQAWVLRSFADSQIPPIVYRWAKWQSILHPLMIAVFGITVLGITSAVLESLYGLVSELASETNWR
jgi:type II secretory pathway component PulF